MDNQQTTRIQQFVCPCCGGYMGEAAPIDRVMSSINAFQQREVLKVLSAEVGAPIQTRTLEDALFGFRKIKPKYPRRVLEDAISRLRSSIGPYGWAIVSKYSGRAAASYRLIPTERGAA